MTSPYDVSAAYQHDCLLVLGDSLTFYGPQGALSPGDTRLWPARLAERCGYRLELFAQEGWTMRHAWWALTKDPRVWDAVGRAALIIVAVGSMDTLPSPLPTVLRENIRVLRPARLRRTVRKAYTTLQPILAPYTPHVALPPQHTVQYANNILTAVRTLRPDVPVCAILPASHCAPSYAYIHTGKEAGATALQEWATASHIPAIDLSSFSQPAQQRGEGNPDGLHWDFPLHHQVADAFYQCIDQHYPQVIHTEQK